MTKQTKQTKRAKSIAVRASVVCIKGRQFLRIKNRKVNQLYEMDVKKYGNIEENLNVEIETIEIGGNI